ncbi:MAG: hypothetical protein QM640_11935 [Niabella sp.]
MMLRKIAYSITPLIVITVFFNNANGQAVKKIRKDKLPEQLYGTWYITEDVSRKKREFIAMPAELQSTITIHPDGTIALNFIKEEKGAWAYTGSTHILQIVLPREVLHWKLIAINDNSVKYEHITKKKSKIGYLIK